MAVELQLNLTPKEAGVLGSLLLYQTIRRGVLEFIPPPKPWLQNTYDDPRCYIGEGVGAPGPGEYDRWKQQCDELEIAWREQPEIQAALQNDQILETVGIKLLRAIRQANNQTNGAFETTFIQY